MSDHDTTPGAPETEALDPRMVETVAKIIGANDGVTDWELIPLEAILAYRSTARTILASVLTQAATRDAAQRAAGWDEAVKAVAWALDNGPVDSACEYVRRTNPFRVVQC